MSNLSDKLISLGITFIESIHANKKRYIAYPTDKYFNFDRINSNDVNNG